MKIPKRIETLVADFEGCYLKAYKCPAGVWTIGYGHTKGVKKGDTLTSKGAYALLKEDLELVEMNLNKRKKFKECDNSNYKKAMISFAFNCGEGNFDKLSSNRNWYEILVNLQKYCKAKVNGEYKVLKGLERRRKYELAYALRYHKDQSKRSYQKSTTTVIQGMLNKWAKSRNQGFSIAVDGIFGTRTDNMVRHFQKYYKLKETGVVNGTTYKQLLVVAFNINYN